MHLCILNNRENSKSTEISVRAVNGGFYCIDDGKSYIRDGPWTKAVTAQVKYLLVCFVYLTHGINKYAEALTNQYNYIRTTNCLGQKN